MNCRIGPFDAERAVAFTRLLARYGDDRGAPLGCPNVVRGWYYLNSELYPDGWWHRFRNESTPWGVVNEMIPASLGWAPS